jgi:hypothetical protein
MTDPHPAEPARDTRGRFQPGQSGNPAGKKPGTLNHATRLKLLLADERYDAMARRLIDAATDGHLPSIRFLMERLVPKPRGRATALDLPAGSSRAQRVSAIVDLMCAGEISAEEARAMIRVLDDARGATDLHLSSNSEQATAAEAATRKPAPAGRGAGGDPAGDASLHFACISRSTEPSGLRARLLSSTAMPTPVTAATITWSAGPPLKRAA